MKEYLIIWLDGKGNEHTKSKTHMKDVETFIKILHETEPPVYVMLFLAESIPIRNEWKQ